MKEEYHSNLRESWNHIIKACTNAIDTHNSEYFKTANFWHLEEAQNLREYIQRLKQWILIQENEEN